MNRTDCDPALLPEYVDGTLDEATRAGVERHLAQCDDCREWLDFSRRLTAAARRLPQPRPDDDAILRLMRAVRRATESGVGAGYGPVLDARELADYLRLDPAALEPYLMDIPCFELGGRLLFRRETVDAWIRQRELAPGFSFGDGGAAITKHTTTATTGGMAWTL